MKYTKGPWKVIPQTDKTSAAIVTDGPINFLIAFTRPELGALYPNAHLIAAAPEMLEMLIEIDELEYRGTNQKLLALIKKASCEGLSPDG